MDGGNVASAVRRSMTLGMVDPVPVVGTNTTKFVVTILDPPIFNINWFVAMCEYLSQSSRKFYKPRTGPRNT